MSSKTTSEKSVDEPTLAPFDRVRVLADGRTFESEPVHFPRGHFRNPVAGTELAAKFEDCAGAVLAPRRARALFEVLQGLANLESISDFGWG